MLLPASVNRLARGTSTTWKRAAFVLLRLACFTGHHVLKVHPRCGLCENFLPLLAGPHFTVYRDHVCLSTIHQRPLELLPPLSHCEECGCEHRCANRCSRPCFLISLSLLSHFTLSKSSCSFQLGLDIASAKYPSSSHTSSTFYSTLEHSQVIV